MDRNRQEFRPVRHPDPGIGGMLLLSIGFHLLIGYLFIGVLAPSFHRDLRPVYYVDLLSLPVADPQAGRPAGVAEPVEKPSPRPEPPRKAEPEPEPKPKLEPKPEPPKPKPKPEPKPETKPELKPKPKPEQKPKPKPKPEPKRKVTAADEKNLTETLQRLQKKKDEKSVVESIKQLAARDTRQTENAASRAPAAPLGEAAGTGAEKGFAHATWLQAHLTETWRYSPYQSERLDLQATLSLHFDANGKFLFYKVEKSSGSEQFDQSIIRAVIKLFKEQPLPNPPKEPSRFEVTFNLKDLQR